MIIRETLLGNVFFSLSYIYYYRGSYSFKKRFTHKRFTCRLAHHTTFAVGENEQHKHIT